MSRIGKLPVSLPQGVTAVLKENTLTVKGPKGELVKEFRPEINIEVKDGEVVVTRPNDEKFIKSLHGTYRSLIAGMVTGVSAGFTKVLEISGSGYKAAITPDQKLQLQVGREMPLGGMFLPIPKGLTVTVDKNTVITVTGIDKQLVGKFSAEVKHIRPVEPYNAKGIKFSDEIVKRKVGKKAM